MENIGSFSPILGNKLIKTLQLNQIDTVPLWQIGLIFPTFSKISSPFTTMEFPISPQINESHFFQRIANSIYPPLIDP